MYSVLKRRKCKSYKEFCKINRKYIKYFDSWRCKHWKQFHQRLRCLYYVWIEYEFTDLDELKQFQKYVNKPFSKSWINLKGIVNKAVENFGKEFSPFSTIDRCLDVLKSVKGLIIGNNSVSSSCGINADAYTLTFPSSSFVSSV